MGAYSKDSWKKNQQICCGCTWFIMSALHNYRTSSTGVFRHLVNKYLTCRVTSTCNPLWEWPSIQPQHLCCRCVKQVPATHPVGGCRCQAASRDGERLLLKNLWIKPELEWIQQTSQNCGWNLNRAIQNKSSFCTDFTSVFNFYKAFSSSKSEAPSSAEDTSPVP